MKNILGGVVASHLLSAPLKGIQKGIDYLKDIAGVAIEVSLQKKAEQLMQELERVNNQIDYKSDQIKITEAQLKNINNKIVHYI